MAVAMAPKGALRSSLCAALLLAGACADEKLNTLPEHAVVLGGITGRICNRDTGQWVGGAEVRVKGRTNAVTTNDDGSFSIEGLPVGEYELEIAGADYTGVRLGEVVEGQVTDIGVASCAMTVGSLDGRFCDDAAEVWLANAQVTLTSRLGEHSASTDDQGRFRIDDIPVGSYDVHVQGGSVDETIPAQVLAFNVTTIGDGGCGPVGGVSGRICGAAGVWLANASVWVELEDNTVLSTQTNAEGAFLLSDIPAGPQLIQVQRGSFYHTFEVTVDGGATLNLEEPVCIPPVTRMLVVTGSYDSIEDVLADLGNPTRNYFSTSLTDPNVTDPEGNIDIVDGFGTTWLELLADPEMINEYQILFFNCGLSDWELTTGTDLADDALANLRDFVDQGGSVYASDWAYSVVLHGFPDRVKFYGADEPNPNPRVGVEEPALDAQVIDAGLAAALARSELVLNLDLGAWVVLREMSEQPAGLNMLVKADVTVQNFDDFMGNPSPYPNAPLLVEFDHGAGRVVYTSFHNEAQTTQDVDDVLTYVVFGL